MADGYARVSGRPGVCFTITGPGLTNILTAMGQAYGDSVPLLVISSLRATRRPVIIAGGGALRAVSAVKRMAEHLDAPVVMTANARGVLAPNPPQLVRIDIDPAQLYRGATPVVGLCGDAQATLATLESSGLGEARSGEGPARAAVTRAAALDGVRDFSPSLRQLIHRARLRMPSPEHHFTHCFGNGSTGVWESPSKRYPRNRP